MATEMKDVVITDQPGAPLSATVMEQVLLGGDLAKLSPEQRLSYYRSVCDSLGLNPLTKPFDFLTLNDKLVLYAKKDCTDQLRSNRGISIQIIERQTDGELCVVVARATDPVTGRTDESIGAVPLVRAEGEWKTAQSGKKYFVANGKTTPLPPDDRANAMMKAETKAKRRATLSLCGLGLLDESEIEEIRDVVMEPIIPLKEPQAKAKGEAVPEVDPQASQQAHDELSAKMRAARDAGDDPALAAIGGYLAKNAHLFTSGNLASLRETYAQARAALSKGKK